MIVLGMDPSMCSSGWAIFETNSNQTTLLACGCIRTDPPKRIKDKNGKTKKDPSISITEYSTDRLEIIADNLIAIIDLWGVNQVVFENPAGSKSSVAAAALASVKGIVIGTCKGKGIPARPIRALEVKKLLTGDRNAEKDIIEKEVVKTFPNFLDMIPKNKRDREAASDAIAVFMGDLLKTKLS